MIEGRCLVNGRMVLTIGYSNVFYDMFIGPREGTYGYIPVVRRCVNEACGRGTYVYKFIRGHVDGKIYMCV